MAKRKSIKKITSRKARVSTKVLSNKIEKALNYLTNLRIKDVIERRFGIRDGKPMTLEAIGKDYGITRERVRQIQDYGLKILKSDNVFPLFGSTFKELDDLFAEHGHIMGEDYLYCLATGISEAHPLRGQLYLVLTLGDPYQRVINDPRFLPYWMADVTARQKAEKIVDFLVGYFNKSNKVFREEEIIDMLTQKHSNLPYAMFGSVLDIAREIDRNVFKEIGLTQWSEITPQGVKDRAYLVLKRHGQPIHFVKLTELINQTFVDRPAYTQTVHNELIKDPRFVLAGRGTYALADWGYEPGTVEQIIQRILERNKKPMTKKEILEAVLAQRQVKPTTIVLNLQRSPKMQRLEDGRFGLV